MAKKYNFKKHSKTSGLAPERLKAIEIMEYISGYFNKPKMFDGEKWYEIEDQITFIVDSD